MAGGQKMSLWQNYKDIQRAPFGGSGWKNPNDAGQNSFNQIPGEQHRAYDPYIQSGQRQQAGLENQYGQLMNNPGQRLNEIGQGYQQSPGFQFAMQQALQGAGHASAAGGMAGSPQHEQQNMQLATNLGNQDYNQWMQNAMGMYGMGMQGGQHLQDQGYDASSNLGNNMSQYYDMQSQHDFARQQAENEHRGGMWGAGLGAAGTALGAFYGGPMGAQMGGQIGQNMGRNM